MLTIKKKSEHADKLKLITFSTVGTGNLEFLSWENFFFEPHQNFLCNDCRTSEK